MNTEKTKISPAKRFVRNPNAPDLPELKLQPKHTQMLRDLHEHRILRTTHLVELSGGSERNTRWLRRLFDNKYIRRFPGEREGVNNVNPAILYALDNRGASFLKKYKGEFARAYKGEGTFNQVAHTLLTSDFLVAVKLACKNTPDQFRYMTQNEILEGTPRLTAPQPLLLTADVPGKHGGRVKGKTVPDGLFGLENLSTGKKRYFFFEGDRGTMVIDRQSKKSDMMSAVKKKYYVYISFRGTKGLAEKEFGFKLFGVLFLTNEALSRPNTVAGKLKDIYTLSDGSQPGVGTWFFSHTDIVLHQDSNVLKALWLKGTGDESSIAPAE